MITGKINFSALILIFMLVICLKYFLSVLVGVLQVWLVFCSCVDITENYLLHPLSIWWFII